MSRPGPLVDHYLREMAESILKVEDSEQQYRDLVACYEEKYTRGVIADKKASDDPRLQQAVGDGAFYRSRATMFAAAATALLLHEQNYPQGGAV